MTIFVDDAMIAWRGKRWCHLMTDSASLDALHAFAQEMGLKRDWFQDHPTHPHYDVTDHKRLQAIHLGAVPIRAMGAEAIALLRVNAQHARARKEQTL